MKKPSVIPFVTLVWADMGHQDTLIPSTPLHHNQSRTSCSLHPCSSRAYRLVGKSYLKLSQASKKYISLSCNYYRLVVREETHGNDLETQHKGDFLESEAEQARKATMGSHPGPVL